MFMEVNCNSHRVIISHLDDKLQNPEILRAALDDPVCKSVDVLKSPVMMAVHGFPFLCAVFVLWAIARGLLNVRQQDWIGLKIGHSFFLDIMLNGFGPRGTPHSLQATLKTHQKKLKTLSFWRDVFAPFDIIVVCCVLVALLPVFLGVGGAVVGGLQGFMTGGSLGVVSARISLPILNWWFGASEDLMASIHRRTGRIPAFIALPHRRSQAAQCKKTPRNGRLCRGEVRKTRSRGNFGQTEGIAAGRHYQTVRNTGFGGAHEMDTQRHSPRWSPNLETAPSSKPLFFNHRKGSCDSVVR